MKPTSTRTPRRGSLKSLFAGLTLLSLAPPAFAGTANVAVGTGGLVFSPAVVNVNPGDKVVWTWTGNFHSTTSGSGGSSSGLWDSGVANAPHSFTNTFNTPGNFPYYCSIHFASGMTGAVVVAAANVAPTVSITSPANGAVFSAPADVKVSAIASDADGSINNVKFLLDASVLADQTASPYAVTNHNLPAGNYTFSAVATDDGGLAATNSVNISVVTPVPVNLSSPQWLSPASFQFAYAANIGLRYVVQRATNLADPVWTDLVTNTADTDPVPFTDTNAPRNTGFYRVSRLPNP